MARRSNKHNRYSSGRDFNTSIANTSHVLPPMSLSVLSTPKIYVPSRAPIFDARLFNPTPLLSRSFINVNGSNASVRTFFSKGNRLYAVQKFNSPWSATPCVRRARRKQIMHAYKYAGRRFGAGKSYRRTLSSSITC